MVPRMAAGDKPKPSNAQPGCRAAACGSSAFDGPPAAPRTSRIHAKSMKRLSLLVQRPVERRSQGKDAPTLGSRVTKRKTIDLAGVGNDGDTQTRPRPQPQPPQQARNPDPREPEMARRLQHLVVERDISLQAARRRGLPAAAGRQMRPRGVRTVLASTHTKPAPANTVPPLMRDDVPFGG